MKKIIFILCMMPMLSFAGTIGQLSAINHFQELCAKEKDPVKRHNYCTMLKEPSKNRLSSELKPLTALA